MSKKSNNYIFCEACKYYKRNFSGYTPVYRNCTNEKNIVITKDALSIYKNNPSIYDVNENNDCKLFEINPPIPVKLSFIDRFFNKLFC
mgnify:CR=1 FL=1